MDLVLPFLVYLSSRVQIPVKPLQPLGYLSGPITFNIFNCATLKKSTNPSVEMLPGGVWWQFCLFLSRKDFIALCNSMQLWMKC